MGDEALADDDELLASLRRGEPEAFDSVYNQYQDGIFGFIWRMTHDRDLAADLFQETWLRVARNCRELADDTRLRPWLFTVARNVCSTHYRWSAAEFRRKEAADNTYAHTPFEAPYDALSGDETRRRLETSIALLPLPYREALLLCVSADLPAEEASAILDITPTSYRKRLSRARHKLRELLEMS